MDEASAIENWESALPLAEFMRKKWRAYLKYKDSGIKWLGQIPEHWVISKFGRHFASGMGETILAEQLVEEGKLPVYSATESGKLFGYVNSARVCLQPGDLIIPARGNSIGHVKLVSNECTATQTTIYSMPLVRSATNSSYIQYYLLAGRPFLFYFDRTAIPQITVEKVQGNPIIFPSPFEQQTISSFLDQQTAKIDALIEKKKRLIELLKEKRMALISHAVTKGVDPKVKMKDSGVEWLGEVPEHWEVIPVFAELRELDFRNKGLSVSTVLSLSYGEIVERDVESGLGLLPESFETYQIVDPGDIVLRLTDLQNDKKSLRVGLVKQRGIITSAYLSLRPKTLDSSYLAGLLHFYDVTKVFYAMGGGVRQSMKYEDLKNMRIVCPPKKEQKEISKFIGHETDRIDSLRKKIEVAIEKLQEYRTALISAAVTGKIDVRGWKAP